MTSWASKRRASFTRLQQAKSIFKKALSPKVFSIVFLVLFCTLMLIKPDYFLDSARRGLSLFSAVVLPSLFPFYFCAMLLTRIGAAKILSTMFQRPFYKLYRTSKESAYIMLLSMISGYPVGAACIKELFECGIISTQDARAISAFASTSGPIFILGTLGSAIFKSVPIGVIILISHYLAAFINGLFYRIKEPNAQSKVATLNLDADNALAASMERATISMLLVGGYMVIAGMLVDALKLLNVDTLCLNLFGEAGQAAVSLLFGAIEMTRGTIESVKCGYPPLSISLAAAIISFGGLSVILQTYNFLSACGMKSRDVILRKFTHSALAFVIAFGISSIFSKFFEII